MDLKDTFSDDFDTVFANPAEFGETKTFEIIVDKVPTILENVPVVWDTETLKNRMIVQQQGVYLGSVLLFINMKWFPVEPKAEQIIYILTPIGASIRKIGWKILQVADADDVWELSLDRLVS